GPAAAELRDRGLLELLLELVEAAEGLVDALGEIAGGLAAAARLHAIPEEGVIPHLGRVVEDAGLAVVLGGRADDLLERLARHRRVLGEIVERRDIGLMMLVVMEFERARRGVRLERILGVRQGREFESHLFLVLFGCSGEAARFKNCAGKATVRYSTSRYSRPRPNQRRVPAAASSFDERRALGVVPRER